MWCRAAQACPPASVGAGGARDGSKQFLPDFDCHDHRLLPQVLDADSKPTSTRARGQERIESVPHSKRHTAPNDEHWVNGPASVEL